MKPKPLWVLSNWIKKKTIERLKKLLSPPHYYWYILPDKSFIIFCKVWLSYLTSINFLVILCLFTHLLLCFFKYFSPNEFLVLFSFPKNCLKSLPINNKKFFNFSPPSSYFQLLLRNQWKNFNLMYYYYYSIEMYQLLINVF